MDGNINILKNEWDFPVDTYNLWAVSETENKPDVEVPPQMSRAIVRTDTNKVLGVHGSKYTAIKHDDVVNSILDAVADAKVSKDMDCKIDVLEDGAKMRGSILFNDLVIEPDVGDYVRFQVLFYNSYDGSWSFQQSARGFRLWCKNGCADTDTIAETISKHTKGISVEASASKITAGVDAFFKKKEIWQEWMKTPVSRQMAEEFFKATLCNIKSKTSTIRWNESRLNTLMRLWDDDSNKLGKNKWALYNAMTYWASHTEDTLKPHNTSKARDSMISEVLTKPSWENTKLIAA